MNLSVVMTALRYVLVAVGSALLVGKGLIDNDTLQQVASAIVVIVSAVWGVVTTSKNQTKVEAAKTVLEAAPAPVTKTEVAQAAATVQK